MASEYLKWKYRDVKPDEPIVLTKAQKRRNWWDYHKWHVVLGILLGAILLDILLSAFGVGRTDPDYVCAYVASTPLPGDSAAALEEALSALGEDLNGDGKVVFHIEQFVSGNTQDESGATYTYASTMRLMADLEGRTSYFFILDDPETFQANYAVLRKLDGSLPIDGDKDYESMVLPWDACPALKNLDLGDYSEEVLGETITGSTGEFMEKFYIARRGFWNDDAPKNAAGCDALWDIITEGAEK